MRHHASIPPRRARGPAAARPPWARPGAGRTAARTPGTNPQLPPSEGRHPPPPAHTTQHRNLTQLTPRRPHTRRAPPSGLPQSRGGPRPARAPARAPGCSAPTLTPPGPTPRKLLPSLWQHRALCDPLGPIRSLRARPRPRAPLAPRPRPRARPRPGPQPSARAAPGRGAARRPLCRRPLRRPTLCLISIDAAPPPSAPMPSGRARARAQHRTRPGGGGTGRRPRAAPRRTYLPFLHAALPPPATCQPPNPTLGGPNAPPRPTPACLPPCCAPAAHPGFDPCSDPRLSLRPRGGRRAAPAITEPPPQKRMPRGTPPHLRQWTPGALAAGGP
jgi:hypothetical protein